MAPIKRKTPTDSESIRLEKRQKFSIPVSKLSTFKVEEPAFPRGGASLLTPLEHKQIQIQATNDVLFEQSTGKNSIRNDFGYEENEEGQSSHIAGPLLSKPRRKKPSMSNSKKPIHEDQEIGVRIEGLSYKVGTQYWARKALLT